MSSKDLLCNSFTASSWAEGGGGGGGHDKNMTSRAVEIPCLTCPTWSHFIQDKLKILIYLSLDKCKICIKLIKFCISY